MSALAALILLTHSRPQESVQFRVRPPIGEVMEFALSLDAERLDGTSLLEARVVVAQRARTEGPNFRLSRYVSFSSAQGFGPFTTTVKEMDGLAGKTFPLLVSPTGERLGFKRAKYENQPDDVPSFAFAMADPMIVGKTVKVTGDDLRPAGEATLRELREVNGQRAAIIAVDGNASEPTGSGTIVVSLTDGLILLAEFRAEMKAKGPVPATRVHLAVRRLNVPGLDRLATELRIED